MGDPRGFLKVRTRRELAERPLRANQGLVRRSHRIRPAVLDHRAGGPLHGLRNPVLHERMPARQHHSGVQRSGPSGEVGGRVQPSVRNQQLPRSDRSHLPGIVRSRLRAWHPSAGHDDSERRTHHHRSGMEPWLRQASAAAASDRPDPLPWSVPAHPVSPAPSSSPVPATPWSYTSVMTPSVV